MTAETQRLAQAAGQAIAVKYALDRLKRESDDPTATVVEAIIMQQLAGIDMLIDLLPRPSRAAIRRKANWSEWDGVTGSPQIPE